MAGQIMCIKAFMIPRIKKRLLKMIGKTRPVPRSYPAPYEHHCCLLPHLEEVSLKKLVSLHNDVFVWDVEENIPLIGRFCMCRCVGLLVFLS